MNAPNSKQGLISRVTLVLIVRQILKFFMYALNFSNVCCIFIIVYRVVQNVPMPLPINFKGCGIEFFFFSHIYKLLTNASLALYLCSCISESIIITTLLVL